MMPRGSGTLAGCLLSLGMFGLGGAARADVTVQSGPAPVALLELYTSEGCSSCPPAEEWFSTLRESPHLWKDVVPVAFHINYWDDLGWKDPLATPAFTARQRGYAAAWGADSVYTPEFVAAGREWRARDLAALPSGGPDAGLLSAALHAGGDLQVTYHPAAGQSGPWDVHAALLGFGVMSDVKAGENGGRHLVHDFVALALQETTMAGELPAATLRFSPAELQRRPGALAVWVSAKGSLVPVQAAGGNL